MPGNRDAVFGELLYFINSPMFQIPVKTFMDENCVIFDPTITPGEDHHKFHNHYKKIIDALLDSFCSDAGINLTDAVTGVAKLSGEENLKELYQAPFEQVLAANNFTIFHKLMTKNNIMIQEQVLMMILSSTGQLPDSFALGGAGGGGGGKDGGKKAPATGSKSGGTAPVKSSTKHSSAPVADKNEEEILKQVMEQSKKEADVKKTDPGIAKTLEISKKEAEALREEKELIQKDLSKLALSDKPIQQPKIEAPSNSAVSSSDAANAWLKSAQAEATQSSAYSAIAAQLSQLNPEELKKRQDFLKQQRDKLLQMKKEAREKQLGIDEKAQPARPASARAARSAMRGGAVGGSSEEDEKKMAMRRAIADKLKQEVIKN